MILGTAQFGMSYSVNENRIIPNHEDCFEMLDYAYSHGVRMIDTAQSYGKAEKIIGDWISYNNITSKDIKAISKLKPGSIQDFSKGAIEKRIMSEIEASIMILCLDKLHGYLLHTPDYLYNKHVLSTLQRAKNEGLIGGYGVSVYDVDDGISAVNMEYDIVQIPLSPLDRRFLNSKGFMGAVKSHESCFIYTRSTYLKGSVFLPVSEIKDGITSVAVKVLRRIAYDNDLSIQEVCYIYSNRCVFNDIVIGCHTIDQLMENVDLYSSNYPDVVKRRVIDQISEVLKDVPDIVINSLWGKK